MSRAGTDLPLVWVAAVWEPSGYADEARGFALALDAADVPVVLRNGRPESPGFRESLPPEQLQRLVRCEKRQIPGQFIQLQHITLDGMGPFHEQAAYRIARSMFETDNLPSTWVAAANAVDEIWVPSAFNVETFRRAGIRVPIHVVPGGIDADTFHPGAPPRVIEGARGTVFLGVFEWRARKGWDVLLRAWAEAFGPDDDVSLVLRSYPIGKVEGKSNREILDAEIDAFLARECGRQRADVAPIIILGEKVPARDLPSLYTAAHCFVLPTRGEGWGRPFMEAMACGVPVITTRWSAHLDFLTDDNALLVDIDGLEPARADEMPLYAHQQWARPSVTHLAERLRQAHGDRDALQALGERGRAEMVRDWPWSRPAALIKERVSAISAAVLDEQRQLRARPATPPDVRVHGGHAEHNVPSSAATPWLEALVEARLDVRWQPWAAAKLPPFGTALRAMALRSGVDARPAAVDLLVPSAPEGAALPTIRLPGHSAVVVDAAAMVRDGVAPSALPFLRDVADVVCVPHDHARDELITLGVAPERVHTTPPAADPTRFTPDGAMYLRRHAASLRLLAFGGAYAHRGLPRLLAAYERAFTAADDIALHLVLQPPTATEDLAWRERLITEAKAGTRASHLPRLWIDVVPIWSDELPAVYRACDVYVHAGRTLTHGRTLAEAMACGRPVIVTDSPFARSLVDDTRGWLVPPGPSGHADIAALQEALRQAQDPAVRAAKGAAARAWAEARDAATNASAPTALRVRTVQMLRTASPKGRRTGRPVTGITPFPLDQPRRTVVLAQATWHDQAMDRLITTHARACRSTDDVSLVVLLDPAQGVPVDEAAARVGAAVAAAGVAEGPDVLLVPDVLTEAVQHALRAAAQAVAVAGAGSWADACEAQARAVGCVVLKPDDVTVWRRTLAALAAR
jgi:glycosyltransferase involved in cell wall biosynthesis